MQRWRVKYAAVSWSGPHFFSTERSFSLLPPLTPSETGLEQSQREGRHRSLRAGAVEKYDCVWVSLPWGLYLYQSCPGHLHLHSFPWALLTPSQPNISWRCPLQFPGLQDTLETGAPKAASLTASLSIVSCSHTKLIPSPWTLMLLDRNALPASPTGHWSLSLSVQLKSCHPVSSWQN